MGISGIIYNDGNISRNGLLGIQYWFYYVYHDDPGQSPHPHDWWYFWVVYDVGEHKPSKAIFDFHHNLRAINFNDPRIHRDWLHVRTYHDAGGHRVMYAPGEEIDARTALKVGRYIQGEEWYWQLINIISPLIGYFALSPISIADALWNDNTPSADEIIGLMVKLMWFRGTTGREGHAEWRAPGWGVDYSFYPPLVLLAKSAGWDPSGDVWKVEEFPHWVWIYEVDENDNDENNIPDTYDSLGQPYSIVKFTYTHPENSNLFDVENPEWWPASYYLNGKRLKTYMPWFSGYKKQNDKYISTTELIWYWHAVDYEPTGNPYPTAVTRYYDTSP